MGIQVIDAANYLRKSVFDCRFMCIFTMNDYCAQGIVSDSVTKGYLGCLCRDPRTISRRSSAMKKNTYSNQHQMWLPEDHPFRSNTTAFCRGVECRAPPKRPIRAQCEQWGRLREEWVAAGATPAHSNPAQIYGVKKVSSFMTLPYWKVEFICF